MLMSRGLFRGPVELVRESTVPCAQLVQKPPVPAAAACTPTLLEQGEVEEQDGNYRGKKGRKPVRHDAPIVSHLRPLGRRTCAGDVSDAMVCQGESLPAA
jgi:hypothetical protein